MERGCADSRQCLSYEEQGARNIALGSRVGECGDDSSGSEDTDINGLQSEMDSQQSRRAFETEGQSMYIHDESVDGSSVTAGTEPLSESRGSAWDWPRSIAQKIRRLLGADEAIMNDYRGGPTSPAGGMKHLRSQLQCLTSRMH